MPSKVTGKSLPYEVPDTGTASNHEEHTKGKKRSHDESEPRTMPEIPDITLPGEANNNIEYDMNCNKIRQRITALLNSGEIKVTHFQKLLGINSNSYGRFMKLKDPWSGIDNQTFHKAYKFFKKRDLAGIKPPKKPTAKKAKTEYHDDQYDLSDIHLPGEEDEDVAIYDTAQDMRNKINALLRKGEMSQAELGRRFGDMFPEPKKLSGTQIKSFLGKKGASGGAESGVYYGSYVFFEKLRIKTGGKETKKRLEVKDAHPGGCERRDQSHSYVFVKGGQRPYVDKFGRVSCQ